MRIERNKQKFIFWKLNKIQAPSYCPTDKVIWIILQERHLNEHLGYIHDGGTMSLSFNWNNYIYINKFYTTAEQPGQIKELREFAFTRESCGVSREYCHSQLQTCDRQNILVSYSKIFHHVNLFVYKVFEFVKMMKGNKPSVIKKYFFKSQFISN